MIKNSIIGSNHLKERYFNIKPERYENCQFTSGIRSLYFLAKLAQKQVVNVVIPPTILLGFNHDNMLIFTKAATKWLTVINEEMHPKLLLKYIKNYMEREDEESHASQTNRIRSSVYPRYVIRYGTNVNK